MKVRLTVDQAGAARPGYVRVKVDMEGSGVTGAIWCPPGALAAARTWLEMMTPLLPGIDIEWAGTMVPVAIEVPDADRFKKLVQLAGRWVPRLARMAGFKNMLPIATPKQLEPPRGGG